MTIALPKHPETWPAAFASLAVDMKQGRPIPEVSRHDDIIDFTTVNGPVADRLARARECGICGTKMGWWVAFIGGPVSIANGAFTTPGMHPNCAKAAITLCPHIQQQRMKRATEAHVKVPGDLPSGVETDKPDKWFLATTRDYRVVYQRAKESGVYAYYLAERWKSIWTYAYHAGSITLVDGPEWPF